MFFAIILIKLSVALVLPCRDSDFVSIFGSNDPNIIGDIHGVTIDVTENSMLVAGNAKIEN
jgi:hypothetical protein